LLVSEDIRSLQKNFHLHRIIYQGERSGREEARIICQREKERERERERESEREKARERERERGIEREISG